MVVFVIIVVFVIVVVESEKNFLPGVKGSQCVYLVDKVDKLKCSVWVVVVVVLIVIFLVVVIGVGVVITYFAID